MTEQNDIFESIVKDLEFDVSDIDDIVDVSKLSIKLLMDNLLDIQDKLMKDGEALRPSNQESRDLHSLRNSIQIELRKRGK